MHSTSDIVYFSDMFVSSQLKSSVAISNKKLLVYILVPSVMVGLSLTALLVGFTTKFYVVVSESMLPTLKTGDALAISRSSETCSSFDCLKVGDIIVFDSTRSNSSETDKTIVHRIEAIHLDSNGKRVLVTKGDANSIPIQGVDYPIIESMYIGKVIHIIPYAGLVLMYLDLLAQVFMNPILYFVIGVMVTAILFLEYKKKPFSVTRRGFRQLRTKIHKENP